MVCSIDPHIKEDDGYFMYTESRELDFFIKDKNGKQYKGFCWPGRLCNQLCCEMMPVVIGCFYMTLSLCLSHLLFYH